MYDTSIICRDRLFCQKFLIKIERQSNKNNAGIIEANSSQAKRDLVSYNT